MRKTLKALKILKDMFPFLWTKQEKIFSLFLISFGLIFISIVLNLSIPPILKEIVSRLYCPYKSMTYQLTLLLLAYGVIWTLSQAIQGVRQIIMVRPLERCIRLFCSNLFDHLHSLPMKFHLDRKTGSIINALERAQQGFPDVFWGLFLFVIPTIIELFLAAAILSFFYGAVYAIMLVLIAIFFVTFTIYATEWASHFQVLGNEQRSSTNANIVDSLLNFASVKYFGNKKFEVLKCDHLLKKREKLLVQSITSMEVVQIGQSLIIGLGLIILVYIAGKQVLLGICDISDFVLINGYILQFATPLSHMGFIARNIRRGINELTGVMEIYSIKRVVPSNCYYSNSQSLKKLESIEFKNVSFGYNSSHLILKDISFHLKLGKTIGIVGATGSGKSTLSNLLFNFYEVQSGSILINNMNIQDVQSESLCKLFGIVPQDLMLFNATIYENILFARPDASKEEVEQVMELAQLGSVIEKLPHHYNTMVGERGLNLSGGEKQRIAIARVLLKQPSLYIFDEATSSLDILTEETIMKKIAPIIKNSAVLIVAHRLSAVVNADEILVLNNGVVEEQGTHAFLLKKGGFYASMWRNYEKNYKDSNVE